MFQRKNAGPGANRTKPRSDNSTVFSTRPVSAGAATGANRFATAFEALEDRRLLSAGPAGHHDDFGGPGGDHGAAIQFSQAPTAVQTGLNALAAAGSFATPTATQSVFLGNANGIESYTIVETGTGTTTRLTVDQSGKAVTPPTQSSTTFGAVANTAVTGEISTIATALNLTAPASTDTVRVSTAADGSATYSIALSSSSTTTKGPRRVVISVDSSGNPVGEASLPLSVFSTAVQTGLKNAAPAGATPLTATSQVSVRTLNGVTFYSAVYVGTGTRTTVTVNTAGVLTSLPSASSVAFSSIPLVAQVELQSLATSDGVSGTIGSTQSVTAFNEGNGTTVYSVRLAATTTDSSGNTHTYYITLSVDQAGNPTVAPQGEFGLFGGGGFFPGGKAGGLDGRH